jgi:hypothetical protein
MATGSIAAGLGVDIMSQLGLSNTVLQGSNPAV